MKAMTWSADASPSRRDASVPSPLSPGRRTRSTAPAASLLTSGTAGEERGGRGHGDSEHGPRPPDTQETSAQTGVSLIGDGWKALV